MPRSSTTPPRTARPLLPDDPSTWTNNRVEAYVVQAVPHTQTEHGLPLLREDCHVERDEPCPGTSYHAIHGVRLDRDEALHAIDSHYTQANWSLCRFVNHASPQYVADLVFEIDAHLHGGGSPFFPDASFYTPAIGVAALAGRRIYDYLVGQLLVDPGFITTCVTRMGSRVTVDWRAFGPRRLHQILAVARFVETQVFKEGELHALSQRLRRAMVIQVGRLHRELEKVLEECVATREFSTSVTIDGGIYGVSDRLARSKETAADFKGPLIRPPGTLHSASSASTMWFRVTPVPHDRFRARHARWLARVSRSSAGPDVAKFEIPKLFITPWPETRRRAGDPRVEGRGDRPRIAPAAKLIELFENWDKLDLPPNYREEVEKQQRRGALRRTTTTATAEITRDVIDAVVHSSGLSKVKARREMYRFECPYCLTRGSKNLGSLFYESGVFHCFSDNCEAKDGKSLYDFASDRGVGSLVPFRTQSSTLLRWVPKRDLPARETPVWSDIARVEREVFPDVEKLRDWMSERLDVLLSEDHDWRVLVITGPTGIGKTTRVLDALKRHGIVVRGTVPRDESREPLIDVLGARPINGRRTGDDGNCKNADIDVLKARALPFRLVCNSACPHREGCSYLAQFEDLSGVSLALNHQHLPFLDMDMFDNGAQHVLIDENPLLAAIETIELDHKELDLLRVGTELSSSAWTNEPVEDVSLDDPLIRRRVGATPRLEELITWLEEVLTLESMSVFKEDVAGDLPLARHWTRDGRLVSILEGIDDADLEVHDAAVFETAEAYLRDRDKPRPPKGGFRTIVRGLRELTFRVMLQSAQPAPLYSVRGERAWSIHVTQRRDLLHGKTIILSSTITPTQFLAAFGEVVLVRRERDGGVGVIRS
jgi:hypothetical protein